MARKNGGYMPESECDKNKNFMCIFKKCDKCKYYDYNIGRGTAPEPAENEEV